MTTSFPETKTGLRLGLASAAVTGCVALVLFAGLPLRAEDANPVLAKVNGSEIRQSDVALAEEELGPSLAQMDPATKKDNALSFLIDMKIVAKAAEDKKVENSEEFKKRLAFTRSRLLMDSLLANEGKAATTDDAMKKVYDEASKQIAGEQEVHARHILVETEDEAKAIEGELKKGADFAELAKKKSIARWIAICRRRVRNRQLSTRRCVTVYSPEVSDCDRFFVLPQLKLVTETSRMRFPSPAPSNASTPIRWCTMIFQAWITTISGVVAPHATRFSAMALLYLRETPC